jgi:hypothetical protein
MQHNTENQKSGLSRSVNITLSYSDDDMCQQHNFLDIGLPQEMK